jgi:hypothetical protein
LSVNIFAYAQGNSSQLTSGTFTFKEGSTVLAGPLPIGYLGGASLDLTPLPAGTHVITAEYSGASGFLPSTGYFTATITPAPLTVTANNATRTYGQANPAFTAGYSGFVFGQGPGVLGGTLTFSTPATAASPVGSYPVSPGGLTSGNYAITFASGTLTVTPAPLSATGVNVSATAGAPLSGAVATFPNADPFGSAASYIALITWGDGNTSAGTISGSGSTLTVSGAHTYADAVNQTVHVTISHKVGYTTTATTTATATVTSLGQGVQAGLAGGTGFWHSGNGQALINSFNGGSTATGLSAWLAASFPNLYGAAAGANNLAGKGNAQVAAFYLTQFALPGPKVEAQVLAAALNVYATTLSLGGTAGQAYGFTVSAPGWGRGRSTSAPTGRPSAWPTTPR